ncbi:MAG: hypothetical protein II820_03185 [Ruminiclostridium sp.]|nr:hypothetical protein [Ruminiclostridium sp.]
MKKTRQIISVFLSVCMIISCMAGFTFMVSAEDDPRIIVSLGDSYSAGEGNAPYYGSGEPIADRVQNQDWLAHRSQSSWGSQLTLSGVPMTRGENWFFAAASNAKTDDLTGGQSVTYSKGTYSGTATLDPQLKVFENITLTDNDFVTMTLGGNDVGFVEMMFVAVMQAARESYPALGPSLVNLLPEDQKWLADKTVTDLVEMQKAAFIAEGGTRSKIKAAYKSIAAKSGGAAIIVAGYPTLFSANGFTFSLLIDINVSPDICTAVNNAAVWLNAEIRSIVNECASEGMNIWYVDVADSFKGHEAYTDEPYINELSFSKADDDVNDDAMVSSRSIHPNAKGIAVYAAAVQEMIDSQIPGSFTDLRTLVNETEDGGTLKLEKDYIAASGEDYINIPEGKTITIDLNGHTIDRNLSEATNNGYVIRNNGNLTITDSGIGGKITGGWATGNYCGGVLNYSGTLTISGGTISGNKATDGGGVYNAGTLIIENGSKITISGNGTEEKTCNVYLKDGAALTVNSTPAAGSEIGISTETLPTATAPVTITSDCKGSADYFTSDNDAYQIVNDGDAAQLIVKPIVIFDKNGGTGNMADSTAVVGEVYELPGCGFEPPADKMFDHWEISGDDGIYYPGNKPVIAANMMQDGVITVTAKWVTLDYEPRVKPTPSSGSGSTSSGSSSSSDVSGSSETNVKMWAQLNDDNSITVGWNKISAVSKYVLYYEKDGKQVKITETSKTKVLIKNAKNNFTYKFTLKVKQGGDIIDAPTGYKISFNCYYKPVVKLTAKDGKVTASWKKVTGAEKYRVYKLVNGKLKLVAETTKNAVRFNVKSGKTYTYAVSALVNDGWTKLVKSDRASIKVK